jgi:hypothetical protein
MTPDRTAAETMPVTIAEITEAFDFASTGSGMGEFSAFVCLRTGTIYYQTDLSDFTEMYDELPNDIDDEDKYVALPDKRELGLGKPLVLDFAREFLPEDFGDISYFFSKRGAYPKFKALLARRGAIDRWHAFEAKATEQALRDWCALHDIEVVG